MTMVAEMMFTLVVMQLTRSIKLMLQVLWLQQHVLRSGDKVMAQPFLFGIEKQLSIKSVLSRQLSIK
jgi:hypothetical protein